MFQEKLREIIEKHFWDDDYCYSPKATAEYSEEFNNLCNQALSQILSLIEKELPKGITNTFGRPYDLGVAVGVNECIKQIKQRLGIKKLLDK